ncbi:E3 ubiquitin-protein ligase TRIM71-like [Ptychodera flava]|uniref:E3 ubiquitin-protein ligase TRIM71-like n=1 Tax=Ptychodera flava TaxID=63121 RepID=UPI00396A6CBC
MQIQNSHPHSTLFSRDDIHVKELHHYKTTFTKTHGKVTTDVYVQEARLGAYQRKKHELVRDFTAETTQVGQMENSMESDFIQLKIGTTNYSRQKKVELREDNEVLTLYKLKGEIGRVTEGHPVKESVLEVFGSGSMPGQFNWARGIYIKKNGQWVICDWMNHRVQVIDPIKLCCDLILQFHAFPKSFDPWNVTVDEDNDQYFMSDWGNGQVVVSSGQSKILNCFGRKEGIAPRGICLSPDGFIFIGDLNGYVRKYNKSGEHIARTEEGQVSKPYGLIVNKKCIFVSDFGRNCVHVLNHQMQSIRDIGKGHLEGPWGLCFDHQQDGIYVCDNYGHRVVHFNCDGEFLSYKGQGQLEEPRYIALCKDNPYRLIVTQDYCVKLLYI